MVPDGASPCRRHCRCRRSSAMIEGISAITLATHDMRRAVRFYRVLGFAMLYGGEDEGFTSFKAGSNFVNLVAQPAARQWLWGGGRNKRANRPRASRRAGPSLSGRA